MGKIRCKRGVDSERVRDFMITAAIVLGGLLMLVGSVYAVVLQPSSSEELAAIWPFYLGGIVAIFLGWINGDLQG